MIGAHYSIGFRLDDAQWTVFLFQHAYDDEPVLHAACPSEAAARAALRLLTS